jgi:GT2 family glycosyltransferase
MDLSIVIVNYKTFELTCNCIQSIYKHLSELSFEIILVDNSPEEGRSFNEIFPSVHVTSVSNNIGFGAANNIGMKQAKGKYFLLLNSDTLVIDNSIQRCFKFMESEKAKTMEVGALGCKLLNADLSYQFSVFPYPENTLWIYFKTIHPIARWLAKKTGNDKHLNFNPEKIQFVGDISGAFMFIKKEIADKAGYFDTDFFMYAEDSEWCQDRLRKICKICYYPDASIIHLGGKSAPQNMMFIQSKLSLSLLWFKRGLAHYLGYLLITYGTVVSMIPLMIFYRAQSRRIMRQFIRAYFTLIPYLFFVIPRFQTLKRHSKKLIYHKLLPVLK